MKRLLPLLLAALLGLTLLSGVSFARNDIAITIEPVTGAPGETVEVKVYAVLSLDSGFGLETLTGQFAYDKNAVRLLDVVLGDMLTELEHMQLLDNKEDPAGYFFTVIALTGRTAAGETPDGLLMTLTFDVLTDSGSEIALVDWEASFYNLDSDVQAGANIPFITSYIDAGNGNPGPGQAEPSVPQPTPPAPGPGNTVLWVGIAIVALAAIGYLVLQLTRKKRGGENEASDAEGSGGDDGETDGEKE